MRLRPVSALLALLAATLPALPASAADNPPAATPADTVRAINTALVKVDTDALDKLARQADPLTRLLATMALDRVHGRFAQSSAEAATCRAGLIDNQPQLALYCALFALGNLRLSGQDSAANTALQQLPQPFQGKLPATQWDQLNHFATLQAARPVPEAELPVGGFTIPVHAGRHHGGHEAGDDSSDTIDAQIDGKPVALRVGTSNAYVVLDQDTAQGLGIQAAADGTDKDHAASVAFGTLDSLGFAGATFRHVPVQVVLGKHIHAIGLSILAYLRTFRVARDGIQVYGPADARPACDDAMLLASDAGGGTGLRLAVSLGINDAQSVALLSFDSPFYLYGNKDAPATPAPGGGHRMGGMSGTGGGGMGGMGGGRMGGMGGMGGGRGGSARSTLEVTLDGKTLRMPYVAARNPDLPWDYALGHAVLGDMDLYVDFAGQHTCLLQH
ncbi:hypothetical protein [Rhodanobacter sp. DHB23]|uniref:hypothetical protein n=1 Tax=Rhodanobacter sp. DHB23 TaxID=2775923 RepID=UPI0017834D9C|nr:hypothetical protein [Rhodanobacter sp. DHB23]MBD8873596.1 hypothetical protein [Rhodanobacter sp. DHB23]